MSRRSGVMLLAVIVAVMSWPLIDNAVRKSLGDVPNASDPEDAHKFADCPECGRAAHFDVPDRSVAPADWSKFECDYCRLRFYKYDDGSVVKVQ